jgi:ketopantoate reductase
VILAVRADQFEAAAEVAARVAGQPRLATATAGLDDLPRLRARFPGRPTAQIMPLFLSWPDGDAWRLWNPPLAKTLVTFENDEPSRAFAEELVAAFSSGGVPSRTVKSVQRAREGLYAAGMPIVATCELVGFDLEALARDAELRALAARSIQEALRGTEMKWLAKMPRPIWSAALRVGPLLPRRAREMWKIHGPKIHGQTVHFLDALVARAGEAEGLRELRRRLG